MVATVSRRALIVLAPNDSALAQCGTRPTQRIEGALFGLGIEAHREHRVIRLDDYGAAATQITVTVSGTIGFTVEGSDDDVNFNISSLVSPHWYHRDDAIHRAVSDDVDLP